MHYRLTSFEFNPEQFDDLMAYANGIKDRVNNIEGLNFAHFCRTSENTAISIAQYVNEEAIEKAMPQIQEILVGMAKYFTAPPSPANAEVVWRSDN